MRFWHTACIGTHARAPGLFEGSVGDQPAAENAKSKQLDAVRGAVAPHDIFWAAVKQRVLHLSEERRLITPILSAGVNRTRQPRNWTDSRPCAAMLAAIVIGRTGQPLPTYAHSRTVAILGHVREPRTWFDTTFTPASTIACRCLTSKLVTPTWRTRPAATCERRPVSYGLPSKPHRVQAWRRHMPFGSSHEMVLRSAVMTHAQLLL